MPPIFGGHNPSFRGFPMATNTIPVVLLSRLSTRVLVLAFAGLLGACSTLPAASVQAYGGVLFDDFDYADTAALVSGGWQVRSKQGHPGIEGAQWGQDSVQLVASEAGSGKHMLRLVASTDGSVEGTRQAQVCHARKYLEGTYAARIRFADAPVAGPDGDVVVETFYAISPLKFDFDPEYSELDWEYLPNGGWDNPETRMYSVTWQTVQIKPWHAFNGAHEEKRSLDGWHTLVMQAMNGRTHFFIDGKQVAEHGGRNYPVVPMTISFNMWFSPGGLLPGVTARRVYQQDVDWVFHAKDRLLSPEQVDAEVVSLRAGGRHHVDTVPARSPALESSCDL
jgi:hypothetical protein